MNGFFPNGKGNRALFLYQLKWLAAFMTVGFGIVYLFTFPVDLVMLIALFLLINIYRRRTMIKKLGVFEDSRAKGIRGFFKSFFQSSTSSSMYGNNNTPLKYYCMSCGNEHKETACPKCGSKMKKVG